jgi:hypothetical protein
MHLQWLDVLNEQAEWASPDGVRGWLDKAFDAFEPVSDQEIASFEEVLNFIRQQANLLHFRSQPDVSALNARLAILKLEFAEGTKVLPPLRAIADEDSTLQGLSATLLLQFAFFASAAMSDPKVAISRCEGLYREKSQRVLASVFSGPFEQRWRQEIPLLVDKNLVDSPDVQRCGDFFVAKAKSRFCSETCRFTTFQLTKQLLDPGYLAAKQKKYRSKNS